MRPTVDDLIQNLTRWTPTYERNIVLRERGIGTTSSGSMFMASQGPRAFRVQIPYRIATNFVPAATRKLIKALSVFPDAHRRFALPLSCQPHSVIAWDGVERKGIVYPQPETPIADYLESVHEPSELLAIAVSVAEGVKMLHETKHAHGHIAFKNIFVVEDERGTSAVLAGFEHVLDMVCAHIASVCSANDCR
jgi:hypothetical protein